MEAQGIEDANEDDLDRVFDWLHERQESIEKRLARRHLQHGSMVPSDLSSSYMRRSHWAVAKFGYRRDRRKSKRQVE